MWHPEGVKYYALLAAAAVFASASDNDANALTANIIARHIPYGPVMDPVFVSPDSDEIQTYSRCGDSAIWTGHFLAAESFHYAVTKSPDALNNVKLALYGIRRLLDVTGNDLLARCAFPENSPYANDIISEESRHGVYSGIVDGEKWTWIGETSRDQIVGVMFGMTAAWDLVDDPEVKSAVQWLSSRVINYLLKHGWITFNPDGQPTTTFWGFAEEQLMILKLGRRSNPDHYTNSYRSLSLTIAPGAIVAIGIDAVDPYSSYYKFNLDYLAMWAMQTSGDNSYVFSNMDSAYKILRKVTKDHQNPFFDIVDRAIKGPNAIRDQRIADLLDQWLQHPRRNVYVDNTLLVPTCDNGSRACDPIPVAQRITTDFLWQRSPFQLAGGGYGTIEGAGIDYTLPYWMARYYGVIQAAEGNLQPTRVR